MRTLNNIKISFFFLLVAVLLNSCDIKKNNEVKPQEEFLKIYDNQSFSDNYIPLDIKQTADEGYIVLAKTRIDASPFYGIYLMKLDKEGIFVSEKNLPSSLVSPGSGLIKNGQNYYFFCMNGTSLGSVLIRVNDNLTITTVSQISGLLYPLSAELELGGNNFILQSYDKDNKKSIVSKITTSGTVLDSAVFDIGIGNFDVEEPIIDHLTGNGKALPFLSGSMGNGTYFFNGFYNYTLSMVFFSFGSNSASGVLQGYKDEQCVSSALYLPETNKFALSSYAYGENTLFPSATINSSAGAVASNSDLTGFLVPEFNRDARVLVQKETINGKSVLIYSSDTRSGQLALYFYDANTGKFIATKHLGYSNTFIMGNCTKTIDEGLAIVGVTYLSGRFPRLCMFKVSKTDLGNLIK